MQTRAPVSEEWEMAIGRSVVYTLLARALSYPTPDGLDELRTRLAPIATQLTTTDPLLDDLLGEVVRGFAAPIDELRDSHSLLFTHIEPEDCPPYESAYNSTDIFRQTNVMADVAAFYRAHGLQVGGLERERPDHITTELEFMGFMAHKEAHALEHLGSEQIEECRRTQAHFLRDHLGCWGPSFGRRVAVLAEAAPYTSVGSLLARWLDLDLTVLAVEPDARLDEPLPQPERDEETCGADEVDEAGGLHGVLDVPVELGPTRPR